jgi:hypothetical protein
VELARRDDLSVGRPRDVQRRRRRHVVAVREPAANMRSVDRWKRGSVHRSRRVRNCGELARVAVADGARVELHQLQVIGAHPPRQPPGVEGVDRITVVG